MYKRFINKVAMITGGAKGLGKEIAKLFAQEGANIIVVDTDENNLKKSNEEFKILGFKAIFQNTNISKPNEIEEIVEMTIERFGKIDFLINNAAHYFSRPMIDIKWEDWDLILNVNIKGTFFMLQNVARQMIKIGKGGSIINIASLAGSGGRPHYIPYAASKAAVMSITQSAAKELARFNIRVNCISPAKINTSMLINGAKSEARTDDTKFDNILSKWKKSIPLNYIAEPIEIAKVVLFLCSADASYITGQILNVCGGLSIP